MIESRTTSVDHVFKLCYGPRSIRMQTCACQWRVDNTADWDLVAVWSTDTSDVCPVCGRSPANSAGCDAAIFRLQEATKTLAQSVDEYLAEMQRVREQMTRERDHPPIARLPQHHWGDFRRRRPTWQKAEPCIKQTRRPKRW